MSSWPGEQILSRLEEVRRKRSRTVLPVSLRKKTENGEGGVLTGSHAIVGKETSIPLELGFSDPGPASRWP